MFETEDLKQTRIENKRLKIEKKIIDTKIFCWCTIYCLCIYINIYNIDNT